MLNNITGNKGEWSEIYVLLRLLGEGKIHVAGENLQKLEDMFFPILKIIREEFKNLKYEYLPQEKVKIYLNEELIDEIDSSVFTAEADYLYRKIARGGNRAFSVSKTEDFMRTIGCTRLAAPSKNKTDITMQIYDVHTGFEQICGFSIKSMIGSPPSLLNVSSATSFVFEVEGLDDKLIEMINNICTREKIKEKMKQIFVHASKIKFSKVENLSFNKNLILIDSLFPSILSYAMLYREKYENTSTCLKIVEKLEEINPLNYPGSGFYLYKFKKFLCSVALGMKPATVWDGIDDANGGYIIVTKSGDVLAYHIYNRNYFEDYLLSHTKFDRGSSARNQDAKLYRKDSKVFFNLYLLIKYIGL